MGRDLSVSPEYVAASFPLRSPWKASLKSQGCALRLHGGPSLESPGPPKTRSSREPRALGTRAGLQVRLIAEPVLRRNPASSAEEVQSRLQLQIQSCLQSPRGDSSARNITSAHLLPKVLGSTEIPAGGWVLHGMQDEPLILEFLLSPLGLLAVMFHLPGALLAHACHRANPAQALDCAPFSP